MAAFRSCLIATLPSGEEREYSLADSLVIGRAPDADIQLKFTGVSRRHARFFAEGGGWSVVDLGSHNGTLVNGQRLASARILQVGDEVVLGPVRLVYRRVLEEDRSVWSIAAGSGSNTLVERGVIGMGTTAEVLRVYDAALDRHLALKRLRPGVDSAEVRARLLREARITAGLEHPGIAPVHQIGKAPDGRPWFTQREIRGQRFDDVIALAHEPMATARWGLRRLIVVFHHVCRTVAYAHARGVIHRDLKPSNLIVGPHGAVFVVDWGLARRLDVDADPSDPAASQFGDVLGTAEYMAPEQARGDVRATDRRSDVYALGGVLYAILAGNPPYSGSTQAVLSSVLDPQPPRSPTGPLATPQLSAIALWALAHDPVDRPADAGVLVDEVDSCLDAAQPEMWRNIRK